MTMERVLILVEGGHIHRATKVNGRIMSFEACNLDDAVSRVEISGDELAQAEPHQLCGHETCFPKDYDPEEAA